MLCFTISFGLKAQERSTDVLNCNDPAFLQEQQRILVDLKPGVEYYVVFPHNKDIEEFTSALFTNYTPDNIYWKDHKLFFTATEKSTSLKIDAINPLKEVIYCDQYFISTSSSLMMDGIQTENGFDISDLISQNLLGDLCIDVSNIDGPSNSNGFGVFTNGSSSIGIEEGVILLTGNINSAEGPNTPNTASNGGSSDGTDPDLAALIGNSQNNVVKVEFDFVPDENMVSFEYVFASEEYCDYVNSAFNDVFGFFISGPGISGPFTGGAENIALVPGTGDPVSINNINWEAGNGLYNTNEVATYAGGCTTAELNAPKPYVDLIGLDGFTDVLTAEIEVIPCETYHIKLVIADIGDGLFDSAIFLGQNSFKSGEANTRVNVTPGSIDGDGIAEEGCENAYIAFNIDPPNQDVTFNFTILPSSTATSGIDYESFPTDYTVPQGTEFDTLWIDIFGDLLTEGIETIDLQITGVCGCDDPIISILIEDPPIYEQDILLCQGETLQTSEGEVSEPGQYLSLVETTGACDSLILYNLDFIPAPFFDTTIYRCLLEPLEFMGETFLFAPDYREIVMEGSSFQGCDSIVRVTFEWANPDLLVGSTNDLSCESPTSEIFIINNPIPENITSFEWVTPNLDTLYDESITVSQPGEYQLLSYIELEDRICSNFFPNSIVLDADESFPLIQPIQNITTLCSQELPTILAEVTNEDNFDSLNFIWILPDQSTLEADSLIPSLEGQYSLVVIDSENGCESIEYFEYINIDTIPNVSIDAPTIGCNAPFVTIYSEVEIPGGNYSWSGPDNFSSDEIAPEVNILGEYTLVYSLSDNCFNTANTTLTVDNTIPELTATGDSIICNQGNGMLSFESDSIVSFIWTGPDGFLSTETNPEVSDFGIYTIEVFSLNGCTNMEDVELIPIDIPLGLVVQDTFINCINSSVELSFEVDSQFTSVSWTGPNNFESNELNPVPIDQGIYHIEVFNQEGCSENGFLNYTIDTIRPDVSIVGESINCMSLEATLDGLFEDAIENVLWTGPNNFSSESSSIVTSIEGAYSLHVTSMNGCSNETSYFVTVDTLVPMLSPISDTLDCNTGIAEIGIQNVTSQLDITWYDPNGIEMNVINNSTTVELDGIYTVLSVDTSNFCASETEIIVYPNLLSPDLSLSSDIITCEAINFQLYSSSSFNNLSYHWTGPNGFTSNEMNPSITESGTYFLQVESQDNCISSSSVQVQEDLGTPTIETSNDTINCIKESIELYLETDGIYTYNWTFENNEFSEEKNPIVTEGGQYSVQVIGSNFCDTSGIVNIYIDTFIQDIELNTSNILDCNNEQVDISLDSNYPEETEFEWSSTDFSSEIPNITVENTGIYTLIVTTANGCTREESIEIASDYSIINIDASDGLLTCYEPEFELRANLSSSNYSHINWMGPNGFSVNDSIGTVAAEGVYVFSVTGTNGCTNSMQIEVSSNQTEPAIQLLDGQLSCNQSTIDISNELDQNYFYVWTWDTNEIENENFNTLTVTEPGNYVAQVTDLENGCTNTASSTIIQLPDITSFTFEVDHPDCFNPFGNIEIMDIEGGSEPYIFSIDGGQTFQEQAVFTDLGAGSYELIVQDAYDCNSFDATEIISLQDFELAADDFFLIFVGELQQLNVETSLSLDEIESITWNPSNTLSCTDCLNPVSSTTEDVVYTVTVIDKNGCIYETSIEIRVLENPYYIPNVFTPNNDGTNEYFSIFGDLELIQNVNIFSIYDRWGERVFHTEDVLATDESMKWYGDFKGVPSQAGVYAYYIEYISISGNIIKASGDVTVIR